MTDGETMLDLPPDGPPQRPNRMALVAGATVGVVILATIGATIGWSLGAPDSADRTPRADGGVSASASPTDVEQTEDSDPPPITDEPEQPTKAPPTKSQGKPQDGLPDLVGRRFEDARKELRQRHLGWSLVFGAAGSDGEVVSTDPPAGSTVARGTTVRVLVAGAAPVAKIPDVVGMACGKARDRIVDSGLYPEYPMGEAGPVVRQDPEPSGTAYWNDRIRLYCGKAPDPGRPSATP